METWYVLEDGSAADPRSVVRGEDGRLRHKDGRKVDYRPHGPRSRSVDPSAERAKAPPPAPQPPAAPAAKEMKPEEPKSRYVTRESKAR